MLGRGLSYLVLFSSLGIIVRWSIGVKLLTSAESQTETGDVVDPAAAAAEGSAAEADVERAEGTATAYEVREDEADAAREDDALLVRDGTGGGDKSRRSILKKTGAGSAAHTRESTAASSSDSTVVGNGNGNGANGDSSGNGSLDPTAPAFKPQRKDKGTGKRARVVHSFPNTPIPSVSSRSELTSASEYDDYDDDDDDDEDDDEEEGESAEWASDAADAEWGAQRGFGRRFVDGASSSPSGRLAGLRRLGRKAGKKLARFWVKFSDFMTVPLWAAVLSLVVACIPPLQTTLNQVEPLKACVFSAPLSLSHA